jgi:acetamidase/formamidase
MDVEFAVELKKEAKLSGPRVETADEVISIGSQPEFASALDNGLKMATSDMADWLVKGYKMEPWAAHLLIGYQGRYDVVTVAGSMALCLPKNRLPKKAATSATRMKAPDGGGRVPMETTELRKVTPARGGRGPWRGAGL